MQPDQPPRLGIARDITRSLLEPASPPPDCTHWPSSVPAVVSQSLVEGAQGENNPRDPPAVSLVKRSYESTAPSLLSLSAKRSRVATQSSYARARTVALFEQIGLSDVLPVLSSESLLLEDLQTAYADRSLTSLLLDLDFGLRQIAITQWALNPILPASLLYSTPSPARRRALCAVLSPLTGDSEEADLSSTLGRLGFYVEEAAVAAMGGVFGSLCECSNKTHACPALLLVSICCTGAQLRAALECVSRALATHPPLALIVAASVKDRRLSSDDESAVAQLELPDTAAGAAVVVAGGSAESGKTLAGALAEALKGLETQQSSIERFVDAACAHLPKDSFCVRKSARSSNRI